MSERNYIVVQVSPRRWAVCDLNYTAGTDQAIAVYGIIHTHDTEGVALKQCRELIQESRATTNEGVRE